MASDAGAASSRLGGLVTSVLLFGVCAGLSLSVLAVALDRVVMPFFVRVGDEVELPDIVEQPLDRAQAELDVHELGLHVAGRRADLRVPKDHVVAQNPAPFTTVKRGRRVYVTLSTGPPLVRVPKCVGDTERNARLAVEDAGLILGAVTYRASKKVTRGRVLAQIPDAGASTVQHARVDLVVSSGPSEPKVAVPSVVGMSLKGARAVLQAAGLVVGQTVNVPNLNYLPGTVTAQDPAAGTKVERQSFLDLEVSAL